MTLLPTWLSCPFGWKLLLGALPDSNVPVPFPPTDVQWGTAMVADNTCRASWLPLSGMNSGSSRMLAASVRVPNSGLLAHSTDWSLAVEVGGTVMTTIEEVNVDVTVVDNLTVLAVIVVLWLVVAGVAVAPGRKVGVGQAQVAGSLHHCKHLAPPMLWITGNWQQQLHCPLCGLLDVHVCCIIEALQEAEVAGSFPGRKVLQKHACFLQDLQVSCTSYLARCTSYLVSFLHQ